MNIDVFSEQVRRLKDVYGDKNYSKERYTLFWNSFKAVRDEIFIAAVDDLIGNQKFAPLFKEITDAITSAEKRDWELRINSYRGLENAVVQNSDPEFVKVCMKVINDAVRNKLTKKQHDEAMVYIDTYCDALEKQSGKHFCKKCENSGFEFITDKKGYRSIQSCKCSKSKPILKQGFANKEQKSKWAK